MDHGPKIPNLAAGGEGTVWNTSRTARAPSPKGTVNGYKGERETLIWSEAPPQEGSRFKHNRTVTRNDSVTELARLVWRYPESS